MRVGDGVIIDASKLGLHGGQLTGVVENFFGPVHSVYLPRRVEREMMHDTIWNPFCRGYMTLLVRSSDITATIPNQGHWLGKEMP